MVKPERTGKEPVPSLQKLEPSGLLQIDWSKRMIIPDNLDLIKSTTYAVLDEDTSLRRRHLARRREWFDTEE